MTDYSGKKVLIVDDEKRLADAIAKFLIYNEGFQPENVTVAYDVPPAIEYLATVGQPYDIIYTDNTMPGGTGIELISHIRSSTSSAKAGIVLATGDSNVEQVEQKARMAGADAFLVKPFRLRKLVDIMEGFLKPEMKGLLKPEELPPASPAPSTPEA